MSRRDNLSEAALFWAGGPLDQFGVPEIIDIEPIHTCNFRCVMCHVSQEHLTHVAIDVEALRRSINSMPLRGKWVNVGSTHEPTMHPQFDEIIALLTEAGMRIDLTTNGSLFTNKLIDKIKGGSFAKVTFSFDGATAPTYEKIRRNAVFHRTLDRISAFKAAVGNDTTFYAVNYTVTKSTLDEIGVAVDLWNDMGFDQLGFISMVLRNNMSEAVDERLDSLHEQMNANLLSVAERIICDKLRITVASSVYNDASLAALHPRNFDGPVVISDHPDAINIPNCRPYYQNGYYPDVPVTCRAPYKAIRISYNGDVFLCFDKFVTGNINRQSLSDIWYGGNAKATRTAIKSDYEICRHCDYFKFCIKGGEVDSDNDANWVSESLSQKRGELAVA